MRIPYTGAMRNNYFTVETKRATLYRPTNRKNKLFNVEVIEVS